MNIPSPELSGAFVTWKLDSMQPLSRFNCELWQGSLRTALNVSVMSHQAQVAEWLVISLEYSIADDQIRSKSLKSLPISPVTSSARVGSAGNLQIAQTFLTTVASSRLLSFASEPICRNMSSLKDFENNTGKAYRVLPRSNS